MPLITFDVAVSLVVPGAGLATPDTVTMAVPAVVELSTVSTQIPNVDHTPAASSAGRGARGTGVAVIDSGSRFATHGSTDRGRALTEPGAGALASDDRSVGPHFHTLARAATRVVSSKDVTPTSPGSGQRVQGTDAVLASVADRYISLVASSRVEELAALGAGQVAPDTIAAPPLSAACASSSLTEVLNVAIALATTGVGRMAPDTRLVTTPVGT